MSDYPAPPNSRLNIVIVISSVSSASTLAYLLSSYNTLWRGSLGLVHFVSCVAQHIIIVIIMLWWSWQGNRLLVASGLCASLCQAVARPSTVPAGLAGGNIINTLVEPASGLMMDVFIVPDVFTV